MYTVRSTIPEGAYFILVNVANLRVPADFEVPDMIKGRSNDWKVSWFIAQTAGVVVSVFAPPCLACGVELILPCLVPFRADDPPD